MFILNENWGWRKKKGDMVNESDLEKSSRIVASHFLSSFFFLCLNAPFKACWRGSRDIPWCEKNGDTATSTLEVFADVWCSQLSSHKLRRDLWSSKLWCTNAQGWAYCLPTNSLWTSYFSFQSDAANNVFGVQHESMSIILVPAPTNWLVPMKFNRDILSSLISGLLE